MKTKSFQKYLEQRLNKDEIAEIEEQAKLEIKILISIQQLISSAMEDYMEKNKIGFNELVRRLDSSPAHVAKIRRGEANLTLSSLAHLFAALGKEPQEVFKSRK
jgi:transcriptional regulator with XRE-family HTH domain